MLCLDAVHPPVVEGVASARINLSSAVNPDLSKVLSYKDSVKTGVGQNVMCDSCVMNRLNQM